MSEEIRKEEATKITEAISQAEELDKLEEMIRNNIIYFPFEEKEYRVRKPNYKEKQEIREVKIKRHNELRNDPVWKYEAELIKELDKKGISIVNMQNRMLEIHQKIEELQLKLAEFGDQKEEDNKIITDLKLQIYNLLVEQRGVSLEKAEYLSESIEAELLSLINSYTCYIGLEIKESDNWVRAFKNYDEFMNSEKEELLNRTGHYMSLLIYR
jgi:hypothetical protein